MQITKRDVGRGIVFQGYDHGIYEGYLDEVKTTDLGFTFARIAYFVPGYAEPIIAPLEKRNWNRIAFRVTD